MRIFVIFISALLLIVGCKHSAIYDRNFSIDDNTWHMDSSLVFTPEIENPQQPVNIYITLRHQHNYNYRNIIFFTRIIAPDESMIKDTLNYMLANEKGQWHGKGLGDIYSNKLLYKQNVKFAQPGQYKISLQHAMRKVKIKGIMDVGLKIEPFEIEK